MADCRCRLVHATFREWDFHTPKACGRTVDDFISAYERATGALPA